jgi:hypothetical protein
LLFISLLLTSLGIAAQELRIGVDYNRMLPAKLEFTSKVQLRTILGPQHIYYIILQVGLEYEIFETLSLAGTYRFSLAPTAKSENLLKSLDDKRRYTAELKYKHPRFDNGIRLSYRLRYQHSATHEGRSRDYLRNRLKVDSKLTKELRPYIAIESYYRLGKNEMNRLRLYLGSEIKVVRTEIELSYIFEAKTHDDNGRWTFHMIGLFLKL